MEEVAAHQNHQHPPTPHFLQLSKEEVAERQARLAKMRALLFYSELKAKRLKNIKSKDYHKRANKADKRKAQREGGLGDAEDARAAAVEAEFDRAKERLTLRHRNSSKWARRALKRGMDVLDEGTCLWVCDQEGHGRA